MRYEIEDRIDVISLVASILIGLAVVSKVMHKMQFNLLIQRGHDAMGSEILFYGLVFGVIGYGSFQIIQLILHKIID